MKVGRIACATIVLAILAARPIPAQEDSATSSVPALRGIACEVAFRAVGSRIRATPNQSRESPVLVRMVDVRLDADGLKTHRVQFIGLVAGDYDLRDYLQRADGSPLDLDPIPIHVSSQLTAGHGTDLFSEPTAPLLTPTRYRMLLTLLAVAWVAVPLVVFVLRAIRRPPEPQRVVEVPSPSLADQLRPLVESAVSGSLSIAQRGRLELLLYAYWRERLNLEGPQDVVVVRLRNDSNAGRLLRAVERWLHAEPSPPERAAGEVASLLEPYRLVPALPAERSALAPSEEIGA